MYCITKVHLKRLTESALTVTLFPADEPAAGLRAAVIAATAVLSAVLGASVPATAEAVRAAAFHYNPASAAAGASETVAGLR